MEKLWSEKLSTEAQLRVPSVMILPKGPNMISLAPGLPHPTCFPMKNLAVTLQDPATEFEQVKTVSNIDLDGNQHPNLVESCQYIASTGLSDFKEWVGQHITEFHKPDYKDWDFLIQAGGTQSLDAIFRVLMNSNEDTILCENLTYSCFLETCRPLRLKVFGVDINNDGVDTEHLDQILTNWSTNDKTKNFKKPKLFYTMPTGHNPTSVTMSDSKRHSLLDICRKHDIIIIEDDPYFHLQLNEKSPPSLLKYDTDGRVIRIDSFSKMLMPGMRVSIITCNKIFHAKFKMFNELTIHSAAASSQLILSMIFKEWEESGFEKWLIHLQSLYKNRRDIMLNAIDKFMPNGLVEFNRPNFGMFIWLTLDNKKWPKTENSKTCNWNLDLENEIFNLAIENDVAVAKGHWFMVDNETPLTAFRLSYSYAEFDQMERAIEKFSKVIQNVWDSHYK
ncbi:hypothetical protein DAMA08_047020 [Martiniozyma asiatica (nom. inval.)]|nr:hypothetical protein DAMA08_047020 [Martiniozyma asiatica]